MIRTGFRLGIPTASILISLDEDSGGKNKAAIDTGVSSLVFDGDLVKDAGGIDFGGRVVACYDERRCMALIFAPEAGATPLVLADES